MIRDWMHGENLLSLWLVLFLAAGFAVGIINGFFKARKIQPRGFKWTIFRNEAMFAAANLVITGLTLGTLKTKLTEWGVIHFHHEPASWWVIGLEYALYFVLFDTYFYWLHRWMHKEPVYTWVHKIHHRSISPNLLTTLSVSPLESIVNGGFVPLFLSAFTMHDATVALIVPTNIIMGLYVHSGYEFMPRWWNKSWATKWFITATFHDQHHRYFIGNFGGYTTVWDRLCGTMRPKFEGDFDAVKARQRVGAAKHPTG
jgi:Delta7-sterol 5-desaturase